METELGNSRCKLIGQLLRLGLAVGACLVQSEHPESLNVGEILGPSAVAGEQFHRVCEESVTARVQALMRKVHLLVHPGVLLLDPHRQGQKRVHQGR